LKLELPLYQTTKGAFNSLVLNSIDFPIKNPQKCYHPLFKNLLHDLWLSGIISYYHENKLYFVLQNPYRNILEELNKQLDAFIKRYTDCFPNDFAEKVCHEKERTIFTNSIMTTNLYPAKSQKDFHIVRSIVYGYFRKIYGFKRDVLAKGNIIYTCRIPKGENKYIFENKFIRQGIETLFEVTPKGRGRIWFDIVTHAFKIDELGNSRNLSHSGMKQESIRFYKKYLSLAQMQPNLRYNKLTKTLNDLGIRDKIEFKFYIWSKSKQFEEYSIIFYKIVSNIT